MRSLLVASLLMATAFAAELGDIRDKPGEVQKLIVPPEQIPPSPALTPAEALKTFKLTPGFRLELVASEPLIGDPVAMAIGPDGRLWVVEMRSYMPDLDGQGETLLWDASSCSRTPMAMVAWTRALSFSIT